MEHDCQSQDYTKSECVIKYAVCVKKCKCKRIFLGIDSQTGQRDAKIRIREEIITELAIHRPTGRVEVPVLHPSLLLQVQYSI